MYQENDQPFSIKKFFLLGIILHIVVAVLMSIYTINEKERGVLLRAGKFVEVVEPGLHLKIPLLDTINKISTQSHTLKYNNLPAYSKDQQTAEITVSVNIRVVNSDVREVYTRYGSLDQFVDRVISRNIPSQVENIFGQYTAERVVQERQSFIYELLNANREAVKDTPIIIESIQVENIDFNDDYERAISDRMKAEVEVAKANQELKKEGINSEMVRVKAKADADAILFAAQAKAESIKIQGEALKNNPLFIELTKAQAWNGGLPQVVGGNTIPFLDITDGAAITQKKLKH